MHNITFFAARADKSPIREKIKYFMHLHDCETQLQEVLTEPLSTAFSF